MKLIRGVYNIKKYHRGCVLTIGNFDGVHRGHQAVLEKLKKEGKRLNLPVMVMIFEPQPLEILKKKNVPTRITYFRDKLKYLKKSNIDYVLCIKFNLKLAICSVECFIIKFLVKKLKINLLIIGDDFRFGSGRQGNATLLEKAGQKYDFKVIKVLTYKENNDRISSTEIRNALTSDSLLLAEHLLGHEYSISGRIVHGNKLASIIGFPTINILLKYSGPPVQGVYIVNVSGLSSHSLPGVANIGIRPTFYSKHYQLEVHLLNINKNFYGYHINVTFLKKLRNEQCFSSINQLKEQITHDVIKAKKFFDLKI
ncbi:Riboflavin biosynthesis protein RibF [Candidatus Ecksteinia adelgidicola]|nr:Riboflavin biosynthesis protein RibF [Candidatus Ecksteinia adelgidicola]